jgi:hypothetical protein
MGHAPRQPARLREFVRIQVFQNLRGHENDIALHTNSLRWFQNLLAPVGIIFPVDPALSRRYGESDQS